jgi:hypothetical protein
MLKKLKVSHVMSLKTLQFASQEKDIFLASMPLTYLKPTINP